MTVLWTSSNAEAATGGEARGDWQVVGVSIDSRSVRPGELFVALTDRRDGHDFVASALEAGAGAAMVSRVPEGVAADAPLLLVDDVLEGLEALGRAGRARFGGKVVGITGSVGKTSTKEMLRTVLGRQGSVHAAEASFNNHWGVPLTLARMPADADFAVIEIGMNSPGEIAPLSRLARPHVAMITTVAPAHTEAFDGLDAIAREKAAIMEGLEPGGVAIVNGDIDTSDILRQAARSLGVELRTFGEGNGLDYRLAELRITKDGIAARASMPGGEVYFHVGSAGRHFAMNALGAIGTADALGADPALAARDMMLWRPPAGRGTRETVVLDPVDREMSIELIDDAFNANPASLAAALEVLAASRPVDGIGRIRRGRRIAVLGDMLELGTSEEAEHAAVATLDSLAEIDIVHCAGPRMKALWEALPEHRRGEWRAHADELAAVAHRLVDPGDIVLVKGSKGSVVSHVVDAIRKLGHPVPQPE